MQRLFRLGQFSSDDYKHDPKKRKLCSGNKSGPLIPSQMNLGNHDQRNGSSCGPQALRNVGLITPEELKNVESVCLRDDFNFGTDMMNIFFSQTKDKDWKDCHFERVPRNTYVNYLKSIPKGHRTISLRQFFDVDATNKGDFTKNKGHYETIHSDELGGAITFLNGLTHSELDVEHDQIKDVLKSQEEHYKWNGNSWKKRKTQENFFLPFRKA